MKSKGLVKKKYRIHKQTTAERVIIGVILALFGSFMLLPLIYIVNTAFKPMDELFIFPPRFFVINPTLKNFRDLAVIIPSSWVPFSRYVFNTVLVTAIGTTGHVILASAAAYAMEKLDFPGRKIMFSSVVLSLMFSTVVTAIPNYLIISKVKLIDTLASIYIPALQSSLGLYLMKQYIVTNVPDSLLESARIEGAGEWRIFFKVVMPIVKPAWLTLIIFIFPGLWNATGGVYIYSEQIKTLPVALLQIAAGGIARAGVSSAISLIMIIVPVIMFIITQSSIMETMATSGLKE
ncbi:MAG: carbohydrate ABC transporter permease [Clostridiaceae bacterium]|nr:carbohydrate ABC transporter permease [Clostridiaceae bacterium]